MAELPQIPFQPAPTLPPLLGMKFFVGSDLFENRAQRPVMVEIEVGFEMNSELIEEPKDAYHLQLTYRAADTRCVLHADDDRYAQFTWADLDPDGALEASRRKIRIFIDPREQLKGLFRAIISGVETCWLRVELTKAALTYQKDKKTAPVPISMKIFGVKLGVDGVIGRDVYEQPMPGVKTSTVEYRDKNRRLTRAITRSSGRRRITHSIRLSISQMMRKQNKATAPCTCVSISHCRWARDTPCRFDVGVRPTCRKGSKFSGKCLNKVAVGVYAGGG